MTIHAEDYALGMFPQGVSSPPLVRVKSLLDEQCFLTLDFVIAASHLADSIVGLQNPLAVREFFTSDFQEGIYKSTCVEFFAARRHRQGYIEYNFSPSGKWAAYSFSSYRKKISDLRSAVPADMELQEVGNGLWTWTVRVDLHELISHASELILFPTVILQSTRPPCLMYFSQQASQQKTPDFHAPFLPGEL